MVIYSTVNYGFTEKYRNSCILHKKPHLIRTLVFEERKGVWTFMFQNRWVKFLQTEAVFSSCLLPCTFSHSKMGSSTEKICSNESEFLQMIPYWEDYWSSLFIIPIHLKGQLHMIPGNSWDALFIYVSRKVFSDNSSLDVLRILYKMFHP